MNSMASRMFRRLTGVGRMAERCVCLAGVLGVGMGVSAAVAQTESVDPHARREPGAVKAAEPTPPPAPPINPVSPTPTPAGQGSGKIAFAETTHDFAALWGGDGSPLQERFVSGALVGEGSHHDDFNTRLQLTRGAQEFDAAHVQHLHVRDHDVSRLLPERLHCLAAVLSRADRVPVTLEQMRQKLTHAKFIIDYEN